ncbi:MAG: Na+/H+ antiporter subunit E [Lachnospiraceae bacterium]
MFILLFILWIIFNGKITTEIVLIGLVLSVLMYGFICKFMDYSIKKDIRLLKLLPLVLSYIGTLLVEIIKANIITVFMIMSSTKKIEPTIVHFKTKLKSNTAKVVLANSITLTPGTNTVSLEEDEFVVHCLDKSMSKDLNKSKFVNMLEKMENLK